MCRQHHEASQCCYPRRLSLQCSTNRCPTIILTILVFSILGNFCEYYEEFSTSKGKAVNKKGVIPLKDAELKLLSHRDRSHCFVIRHPDRRPVYLCATSENEKFVWLEAMEKASVLKDNHVKGQIDLTEYVGERSLARSETS